MSDRDFEVTIDVISRSEAKVIKQPELRGVCMRSSPISTTEPMSMRV